MRLAVGLAVAATLVLGGCLDGERAGHREDREPSRRAVFAYPAAPAVPSGPLDAGVAWAASRLGSALQSGALDSEALEALSRSRDARLGWLLADVLRFTTPGQQQLALVSAFGELTGVDIGRGSSLRG